MKIILLTACLLVLYGIHSLPLSRIQQQYLVLPFARNPAAVLSGGSVHRRLAQEPTIRKPADRGCIKKLLYNVSTSSISYECAGSHPDCFSQGDYHSANFGRCESVTTTKRGKLVVIDCRCAA